MAVWSKQKSNEIQQISHEIESRFTYEFSLEFHSDSRFIVSRFLRGINTKILKGKKSTNSPPVVKNEISGNSDEDDHKKYINFSTP